MNDRTSESSLRGVVSEVPAIALLRHSHKRHQTHTSDTRDGETYHAIVLGLRLRDLLPHLERGCPCLVEDILDDGDDAVRSNRDGPGEVGDGIVDDRETLVAAMSSE